MAQKFHGANAQLTLMKSIIWRSSWFFERRFDEDHSSLNTVSYDAFLCPGGTDTRIGTFVAN